MVGIVPAAGRATRLQPLESSKEVLELAGRPLIDYVVERMRAAPVDELRVVTRPRKEDVVARARTLGAKVLLAAPSTPAESVRIGARGLHGGVVLLLGFPDTIWEPLDGYTRLLAALEGGAEASLGLFRFAEPERCDAVTLTERGLVARIEVKARRPSSNLVWGAAAIRARALNELAPDQDLGRFFEALAETQRVVGVELSDRYADVGTRSALAAAQAAARDRHWTRLYEPSRARTLNPEGENQD